MEAGTLQPPKLPKIELVCDMGGVESEMEGVESEGSG